MKSKLEKFIKMRNESEFQSNLQFQSDLEMCGLKVSDLGECTRHGNGWFSWETPCGTLVEDNGTYRIED